MVVNLDQGAAAPINNPTFTGVVTTPALTLTTNQFLQTVNTGITASTTQTQGQQPLTGRFIEITTVANFGDTVTLPKAVTGLEIEIVNSGLNTAFIFPDVGDNIGFGTNVQAIISVNNRMSLYCKDGTSWIIVASTTVAHGEMNETDNTVEYVINDAGGDHQLYHSALLIAGDLAGFSFDAGGNGVSFPIASIADAGSGDITVTTTGAHGLEVGAIISQSNLADAAYVGEFKVITVPTTTTYTVTAVFTATGTGTMDEGASIIVSAIAAGTYLLQWHASGTSASNNITFDFFLHLEENEIVGSKGRNKFGTGGDFSFLGGQAIVAVAAGERLLFALANQDSASNITIRDFSLIATRI